MLPFYGPDVIPRASQLTTAKKLIGMQSDIGVKAKENYNDNDDPRIPAQSHDDRCDFKRFGCNLIANQSMEVHFQVQWPAHLNYVASLVQITLRQYDAMNPMMKRLEMSSPTHDIERALSVCARTQNMCEDALNDEPVFWGDLKPRLGKLNKEKYWLSSIKERIEETRMIISRREGSILMKSLAKGTSHIITRLPLSGIYASLQRFSISSQQTRMAAEDLSSGMDRHETSTCDGDLVMKVENFDQKFGEAISNKNPSVYGSTFRSQRYGVQMCPVLKLYGDKNDISSHGKFVSFYIGILHSDFDNQLVFPMDGRITMSLCSIPGGNDYRKLMQFKLQKPDPSCLPKTPYRLIGFSKFISHKLLHSGNYIKDGTLYIRVQVHLIKPQ